MKNNQRMIFRVFFVALFFIISFICNAVSLTGEALQIFENVYHMNEREESFLTETLSDCDDTYLLDWYIYFCGEKDYRELPRLRDFYIEKRACLEDELRKTFGSVDVSAFPIEQQKKFAELLNVQLHNFFFKEYKADSDNFLEIVDYGRYNCVSSSILYVLLLSYFGVKAMPVQTTEHVFVVVYFPDGTTVDVETTNAYGYDPGKKKEVLDELGKVTGFSYVKQKDYKNRFNISLKSLLLLPVHNRSAYFTKIGNHQAALRLASFLMLCRNDERGDSEFHICYYNLLADLSSKHNFETELRLLYYYLENIDAENVRIRKMRFQALTEMILSCNSDKDFENVQSFFDIEKSFCRTNEEKDFRLIEDAFYVSKVQFYYKNSRVENAFKVILKIKDKKNKSILLRNAFAVINQNSIKTGDFDTGHDLLLLGRKFFPDSQEFSQAIMTFWNNYLVSFTQHGDYIRALTLLEQEKDELKEKDKLKLMQILYNSYAYSEYKEGRFLKAAEICVQASKVLGKEKVIMENMKVYYLNALNQAKKVGDLKLETEIKNKMSVYFPDF